MRFLIVLGLLATRSWVSAVVYQDIDLEAVVIEDDPDDGILLEPEEETTTQLPVPSNGSCTNANGVPGTCMKFEECFPYAVGYEKGTLDTLQLFEILKEAATPCEGTDNLVCCPNYAYGLPNRKPQFAGQTTQKPSTTTSKPVTNSTSGNSRNQNCGANKYQDLKVVGGRAAQVGEFPFAVALLNKGRQFCGGSLISNDWVLTAAHCIVNFRSFSSVTVNVGDHDVSKGSEVQHQSRGIKRGLYNKHFSMRHLQHDVALLQLDKPVTFSERIQPVCLSSSPPPSETRTEAVLAGWGKQGKNLPPSSVLRTVKMKLIPHEECKRTYASEPMAPPVTTGMVCAGEKKPTLKDACNGDSGGPLSIFGEGKATQIGVVSWGLGCGDKPGVYTRVDQYLAWIDKNSKRSLN